MELKHWQNYLHDRLKELEPMMATPWGFICACIVIELLARMTNGIGRGKLTRQQFEAFIEDWMPRYSSTGPAPFKFKKAVVRMGNGNEVKQPEEKSLATQMYCIMRSSMVHNLSLVAGLSELRSGGVDNSIVLLNRKAASERSLKHLDNADYDAAIFVGEEFLADIHDVIDKVFLTAENNSELHTLVCKHLSERTPVEMIT